MASKKERGDNAIPLRSLSFRRSSVKRRERGESSAASSGREVVAEQESTLLKKTLRTFGDVKSQLRTGKETRKGTSGKSSHLEKSFLQKGDVFPRIPGGKRGKYSLLEKPFVEILGCARGKKESMREENLHNQPF